MGPVSGLVLFAVIWTVAFFIILPQRLQTQGEKGEIVPGTHASSPADFDLKRKAKVTTMWAFPIWLVIATILLTEAISVRDLDWFDRMSTPEVGRD